MLIKKIYLHHFKTHSFKIKLILVSSLNHWYWITLLRMFQKMHSPLEFLSINIWLNVHKLNTLLSFFFNKCIPKNQNLIKDAYIFWVCSKKEIANQEQVKKYFKQIDMSISSIFISSSSLVDTCGYISLIIYTSFIEVLS